MGPAQWPGPQSAWKRIASPRTRCRGAMPSWVVSPARMDRSGPSSGGEHASADRPAVVVGFVVATAVARLDVVLASSGWPGSATRGPGTGRMHGARSGLDAVWLRRRPPPSGGRHDARFLHQPAGGVRKISGAAAQREVIPAVGARIVGSRRHEPWCRGRPPLAMGGAHQRRAVETPRPRPLTIARRRSGRFGVLVVMPLRGRARVLRRRVAHPLDAFADHRVGQGDPGERSGLERRGRGSRRWPRHGRTRAPAAVIAARAESEPS